jgi:hypothetical protein
MNLCFMFPFASCLTFRIQTKISECKLTLMKPNRTLSTQAKEGNYQKASWMLSTICIMHICQIISSGACIFYRP